MKLIVGLGNPGKEYCKTRHNIGFMVMDAFAEKMQVDIDKESFHALFCRLKIEEEDIFLCKPMTYMNASGIAVQEMMHYFKIPVEDVIVIYDDMALSPGKIRLREKGSSGGHKGMQSIIDTLKTENIKRIRVGIGEPTYQVIDYVLGCPSEEERIAIEEAMQKAVSAIQMTIRQDFHHAMSKYN